jgi:hypothetical protein
MVMCMMTGLASSTVAMALKAMNSPRKFDVLLLTLSISLIFGLPALRNIQPNVPSRCAGGLLLFPMVGTWCCRFSNPRIIDMGISFRSTVKAGH